VVVARQVVTDERKRGGGRILLLTCPSFVSWKARKKYGKHKRECKLVLSAIGNNFAP
jgi:hypothetical protein